MRLRSPRMCEVGCDLGLRLSRPLSSSEGVVEVPDLGRATAERSTGTRPPPVPCIGLGPGDVEEAIEHADGLAHLGFQVGGEVGLAFDFAQLLQHPVEGGAKLVRDGVREAVGGAVEVFDAVEHGVNVGFEEAEFIGRSGGRGGGRRVAPSATLVGKGVEAVDPLP